jgi:hypothetical protein
MHGNIVPVAPETSANDYLDIDAAVERISRLENRKLTTIYRDTADAAWRTLCRLAPSAARILTGDGLVRKPDPVQFEGFADKSWKFASILRYPPNDEGVPGEIECSPSYNLLDEHGRVIRGAQLVFLESEIDTAFWATMEPKTKPQAAAKWLREKYGAHRPALTVDEILRAIKDDRGAPMKNIGKRTLEAAIALAWQ